MEVRMKSKGIRISDSKPLSKISVLNVSPIDILEFIDYGQDLKWAILDLEATGDLGKDKWDQLAQFDISKGKVTEIEWKDLVDTSKKFEQVIWMTIIGSKNQENLHQYSLDFAMYEFCEIVIEIVDGGCCEVFSHDHQLIDKIAKKFKDVEFLSPDWNTQEMNSQ